MFEPLPDVIRLRRLERNLSLEAAAKLAGVSRRQLWLLEEGHNVSLAFLLKVADALELTELPIAALRLRAAPPDLRALILAAEAVANAKRVAGEFHEELDSAGRSIDALVERALASAGSTEAVRAAAKRLEDIPARDRGVVDATLRELAASPGPRRAKLSRTIEKPAARKRAR